MPAVNDHHACPDCGAVDDDHPWWCDEMNGRHAALEDVDPRELPDVYVSNDFVW